MDNKDTSTDFQGEIRALTFKQPFAELMLHGKIETRTWHTDYRGWVLICAGLQNYTARELDQMITGETWIKNRDMILNIIRGGNLYNGRAIAIGRLVDCRPMQPEDAIKCFVDYRPGLWCHIYEDVQQIEPIYWKGSQGWKLVSDEVKEKIKPLR